MRRRLLIGGCIVCALLLAATIYAWIASYECLLIRSAQGKLYLVYTPIPENVVTLSAPDKPMSSFISGVRGVNGNSWSRLGVEYLDGEWFTAFGVSFAYLIALPLIALLLLVHWLRRDARRRRLGLCRSCGYDLRESTGRCPECGAESPVAKQVA